MLDLLGQTHTLGIKEFGKVARLDWQARESGWLIDDLVVTSVSEAKSRTVAISAKSGQQVTVKGFPGDFVRTAWFQWFKDGTRRHFARSGDVIVLATGQGTTAARDPWDSLLRETLSTSSNRIVARLTDNKDEGQQTSKEQRAIFGSFACPIEYQPLHTAAEESVDLIRQVRWLDFDYESPTSQAYGEAVAICKSVMLENEAHHAQDLWERLKEIADDYRKVGGTLQLPDLLAKLHGKFAFKANPDYAGDWLALKTRSDAELASIKTDIAGLLRLERQADLAQVSSALHARSACFLIGDSGSGKSALAKEFAMGGYERVIWLTGDMLEYASLPDFEKDIGLSHSIADTIDATLESTVIVLDAVEAFSARARKVATQLVNEVRSRAAAKRTHIILTAQAEAARNLSLELFSAGFPSDALEATVLGRPSELDLRDLVSDVPKVGWVALNPEVRPLLTNLKMLDWFVGFSQSGGAIAAENIGLTDLIDSLWDHWVTRGTDGLARSDLLKQVATIEADKHINAVPTSNLGHAEQTTLRKLADEELVRVRDERIQFSHDLLSDWSRLRVLIGDNWLATPATRERFTPPKWHRAIRLYGQRLLEKSGDGEEWRKQLETVSDNTPTDTLIRNLFLEALLVAPNATNLLRQAWPTLAANGAPLLKALIERFLYVATTPDPRLVLLLGPDRDVTKYEHVMRLPYAPYWGPLISVLHENRAEVAKLVPNEAAKICAMWLRAMDFAPKPGRKIIWRREAAELAYFVARQIQMADAVREAFQYGGSKVVYEALLLASTELPSEVSCLCLELADRRDVDPVLAAQIADARARQMEKRKKALAGAPIRRSLPGPISLRGPLRKPWPDGPRKRVDTEFFSACLDGNSYGAFARANPEAALEVLLAVCIEAPQHEEYGMSPRDDLGLNSWHQGDPPIWFRGPFLALLNVAPDHGLSFVIKLTNFATARYESDEVHHFKIGSKRKGWRGDSNIFAAHYDGHLMHGAILQCALMALEKWLYDRIEAGGDVTPAVTRIMNESESLALAGLLLMVGKRQTDLLFGPLAPLLEDWVLVEWDLQLTIQRAENQRLFGFWGYQPQEVIRAAQSWMGLAHRKTAVRDILIKDFLPLTAHEKFFENLVATWQTHLSKDRKPVRLRRLIEFFRKSNYEFREVDGKLSPIAFKKSPEDQAEDAELSNRAAQNLRFMMMPLRCRQLLDNAKAIGADQVEPLADFAKSIHERRPDPNNGEPHTAADVVLAGVAVLVCLHYDWLASHSDWHAWCRERLEEATKTSSVAPQIYSHTNIGNDKWDAFAAECGVSLLCRDRSDMLARRLVARGIVGFFNSTTRLVVNRAASNHGVLGDDFRRIVAAALEWSAVRPLISASSESAAELEKWNKRREELERRFVEGSLPPMLPDLKKLNIATRDKVDEIRDRDRFGGASKAARKASRKAVLGSRVELYPERLGLDSNLLRAAMSWLRPDTPAVFSRAEVIETIKTLLNVVLGSLPKVEDPKEERIEGLPTEFDSWVFGVVSTAIPLLMLTEKSQDFWRPVLGLPPAAHDWVERFFGSGLSKERRPRRTSPISFDIGAQ